MKQRSFRYFFVSLKRLLAFFFAVFALLALYIVLSVPRTADSPDAASGHQFLDFENAERKLEGVKALYYDGDYLYCAKSASIIRTKDLGRSYEHIADISYTPWYLNLIKHSITLRRLFRMDIYRLRVLKNGDILFSSKTGIYRIKRGEKTAHLVSYCKGSRPISLTVDSHENIYYGEYYDNIRSDPISIFKSSDGGNTWCKAYTFPAKKIFHVHAVEYDKYDDCLWITTGDGDNQTFMIKSSTDFKRMETVAAGGQSNRYFEVKVTKDFVFATPDSPDGFNALTVYDKRKGELKKITTVEGPTFFSTILGDSYICATSDEPYAQGRCEYLRSHLWAMDIKSFKTAKVAVFHTDWLYRFSLLYICPTSGLFQFSQAYFPEGTPPDDSKLLVYGNGLDGFGGSTYIWDIKKHPVQYKNSPSQISKP